MMFLFTDKNKRTILTEKIFSKNKYPYTHKDILLCPKNKKQKILFKLFQLTLNRPGKISTMILPLEICVPSRSKPGT